MLRNSGTSHLRNKMAKKKPIAKPKIDKWTKMFIRTASDKKAVQDGCYVDLERAAYAVWWIERHCKLYESVWAGKPLILRSHADEVMIDDPESERNGEIKKFPIPDEFPEVFKGSKYEKQFKKRVEEMFARKKAGGHISWQFHDHIQIYGWVRHDMHWKSVVRRFKIVYFLLCKKSGKSPTLAANALYLTCGDGEQGNKTYIMSREAAQVKENIGKAIVLMVEQSPELLSECKINYSENSVEHLPTNSLVKPVSGRDVRNLESKEGPSGQFFFDEMHTIPVEARDRTSRAGIARPEPINMGASTAGLGFDGFGKEVFELCDEIMAGTSLVQNVYASIHQAPQNLSDAELEADPMKYIQMANSNLGITISPTEILEDYNTSKRTAQELSIFKVYRLNIWQHAENAAFSIHHWTESRYDDMEIEAFNGLPCYPGFDRSMSGDLTSLCKLFEVADGRLFAFWQHWLPRTTAKSLAKRVPYLTWEQQGWLKLVDGPVIEDTLLYDDIMAEAEKYEFWPLQYDPSRCGFLMNRLSNEGNLDVEIFQQSGRSFHEIIDLADTKIKKLQVLHVGNPLIQWQMSNCNYYEDVNSYRLLKKPKKRYKKIDGIVAFTMALRGWRDRDEHRPSTQMLENLNAWKDHMTF